MAKNPQEAIGLKREVLDIIGQKGVTANKRRKTGVGFSSRNLEEKTLQNQSGQLTTKNSNEMRIREYPLDLRGGGRALKVMIE